MAMGSRCGCFTNVHDTSSPLDMTHRAQCRPWMNQPRPSVMSSLRASASLSRFSTRFWQQWKLLPKRLRQYRSWWAYVSINILVSSLNNITLFLFECVAKGLMNTKWEGTEHERKPTQEQRTDGEQTCDLTALPVKDQHLLQMKSLSPGKADLGKTFWEVVTTSPSFVQEVGWCHHRPRPSLPLWEIITPQRGLLRICRPEGLLVLPEGHRP